MTKKRTKMTNTNKTDKKEVKWNENSRFNGVFMKQLRQTCMHFMMSPFRGGSNA